MAVRASAYLASADELNLADLIVAETVDVLESYYDVPRPQVAQAMRSLIAFDSIVTVDPALLSHRRTASAFVNAATSASGSPTLRMGTTGTQGNRRGRSGA